MTIIDDISAAREQYLTHGRLDSEHPSVKNLARALENGSLSAFDAKLAQVAVSESVRPADGFSGSVAALSPIFWVRGDIDLPEKATLGDWEAGRWIADRRREITAGESDLDDWEVETLRSMNLFGPRDFDGIPLGADGHRVALADRYTIAGGRKFGKTTLALALASQLVARGLGSQIVYVGSDDITDSRVQASASAPEVWPKDPVIVCDYDGFTGFEHHQIGECRDAAAETAGKSGAILIEVSSDPVPPRETKRQIYDLIVLPLEPSMAEDTLAPDLARILEGGGISPRPALEFRPDDSRAFFTVADLT